MSKYSLILLLGGSSTRFNGECNKVYTLIDGKPLFRYSLDVFLSDSDCESVYIVYNKNDLSLLDTYLMDIKDSRINIVVGGSKRHLSVYNGLLNVKSKYVFVHDGARPFVSISDIEKLKKSLMHHASATLAYKINNTIKESCGNSIKTLDRSCLFGVITPQAHHTEIFRNLLEKALNDDVIYDDLMVFERYSDIRSDIIFTMNNTVKVTTIEDLGYIRYLIGEKND